MRLSPNVPKVHLGTGRARRALSRCAGGQAADGSSARVTAAGPGGPGQGSAVVRPQRPLAIFQSFQNSGSTWAGVDGATTEGLVFPNLAGKRG